MKKKILLVDDEETLRWALHEALSEEGFDIENTNDSVKALAFTRKTKYDLVISDLKMPIMGGLQLISEIKKQNPDTKAIIITAYGSVEAVIEAMHLGVLDFITKPFKIEHIKSVIYRVLNDFEIPGHNSNVSRGKGTENKGSQIENVEPDKQTNACFIAKGETGTANQIFYDFVEMGKLKAFLFGSVQREVDEKYLDIMIRTGFRYMSKTGKSPAVLLKEINSYLCKNIVKRFPVTLFCAILDEQEQTLHYSPHGEDITCFLRLPNKEVKLLESLPYPLNMFPGIAISESDVSCVPNSKLVLIRSSTLSKSLRNGMITVGRFKDAISDGSAKSCEDLAKDIKLQIEGLDELIAEEKDGAVIVLNIESGNEALWEEEMTIAMPLSNYSEVLEQFEKRLSSVVVNDYRRREIVTSVNEAVLNAASFAYPENKKGEVFLKFSKLGDELIVEVSDRGCGFDIQNYVEPDVGLYRELTKKSGRGIFIMKQLMDRVMIQSSKEMGTMVHMAKRVICNEN